MIRFWLVVSCFFVCFYCVAEQEPSEIPNRIISLAPHTTELVFELGAGNRLVAVSDFSDYPSDAKLLPSVASYQGLNFEQIIRLNPDLIVVWQGGNKPQDLSRLAAMGMTLFYSSPKTPEDIAEEIIKLGDILGLQANAKRISSSMLQRLASVRQKYAKEPQVPVFYYMWPTPLMSIGKGAWANQLLSYCGAKNIFIDAIVPYPEVSVEQVYSRQPKFLIAAMNTEVNIAESHWSSVRELIKAPVITVNPDLLHRFTPRLIDGLVDMCEKLN
jgi:vitamin B12 transport system substrate-binding protein